MKSLLGSLGVILLVVMASQAGTINLNQHIANPTFDMDPAQNGNQSPWVDHPTLAYDYRNVENSASEAGALGWYEPYVNNSVFYIRSDDGTWEDTSPSMLGIEGSAASAFYSAWNTANVDIQAGDEVTFRFLYKSTSYGAVPAYLNVLLYDGSSVYGTQTVSNIAADWQEYEWSYTHSGDTLASGSYVLALDMRTTTTTGYHAMLVDSIVPEPATVVVLMSGGVMALLRKRKV